MGYFQSVPVDCPYSFAFVKCLFILLNFGLCKPEMMRHSPAYFPAIFAVLTPEFYNNAVSCCSNVKYSDDVPRAEKENPCLDFFQTNFVVSCTTLSPRCYILKGSTNGGATTVGPPPNKSPKSPNFGA